MSGSSTPFRDGKFTQIAIFLAILMITPQMATFFTQPTYLQTDTKAENSEDIESKSTHSILQKPTRLPEVMDTFQQWSLSQVVNRPLVH